MSSFDPTIKSEKHLLNANLEKTGREKCQISCFFSGIFETKEKTGQSAKISQRLKTWQNWASSRKLIRLAARWISRESPLFKPYSNQTKQELWIWHGQSALIWTRRVLEILQRFETKNPWRSLTIFNPPVVDFIILINYCW